MDKGLGITPFLRNYGIDTESELSHAKLRAMIQDEFHLGSEELIQVVLNEVSGRNIRHYTDRMERALDQMPYAARAFKELRSEGILDELCQTIPLNDSLYWMIILEALVTCADDDIQFLKASRAAYQRKIDQKLKRGTFFTYVKYLTVDSSMQFRFQVYDHPDGLALFRKKRLLRYLKLPLNIVEAAITDFLQGNFRNSWAGFLLILSPAIHYSYDPRKRRMIYKCRPGYEEPYLLWNLAFCLRSKSHQVHSVIGKLLFPGMLEARDSNFLTTRGISLWYALQTIFVSYDRPCSEAILSISEKCANRIEEQAYRSTMAFKSQVKFEFVRNLKSYLSSEKK